MKLKNYFILKSARNLKRHSHSNPILKDKKGMSFMIIGFIAVVALLITLLGSLIYAIVNKTDLAPMFLSIESLFNTIKWWILGIGIFLLLLLTGIFKIIRTKIFHV